MSRTHINPENIIANQYYQWYPLQHEHQLKNNQKYIIVKVLYKQTNEVIRIICENKTQSTWYTRLSELSDYDRAKLL